MQNIPVFTTSAGLASLVLKEIPLWGKAYVLPSAVFTNDSALARECAGFCRAAGAKEVFYRCDDAPEGTRFHCEIWELTLPRSQLPDDPGLPLEPLTEEISADFLALYNRAFAEVDNAACLDTRRANALLQEDAAWVYRENGVLLGLGIVKGSCLEAVAAARKGLGYPLALSLLRRAGSGLLHLQTASTNAPALHLYERLGFEKSRVISRWHSVLPDK